jgi:ornithine decarboxylase
VPLATHEHDVQLAVPPSWPAALHPNELARLEHATPFVVCDLETVRERYESFTRVLPGVECFYALKCNPAVEVLEELAGLGSKFEIASHGELELVRPVGVDPGDVLYSNPVKPPAHIEACYEAGVWRFAFDSEAELYKIARNAPGSAVFLRVRVDDSTSVFPLSRKFGVEPREARPLLLLARRLGLRPYGITFHVGSQCTDPEAWHHAIAAIGWILEELAEDRVSIEMLNVGGGFPARYASPVPDLDDVADAIFPALAEDLPYVPPQLAAEPGRYLVAESAVLVAGVIGREVRAGQSWVYLDVGAYNGLIETQQTRNRWAYPLWSSREDHTSVPQDVFTVTGPTCDSSDTLFVRASLPSTLDVGDRLYIGSTGAYTLSYASSFNGFPPPEVFYTAA